MTEWIGSLRLSERTAHRVVLSLSSATRLYGAIVLCAGVALAWPLWELSPWARAVPIALAGIGVVLLSVDRRLTFDREAGVLRLESRTLGIRTRTDVPLFHLRAVCVVAQPPHRSPSRYVAFIDRRVGEPIYLDEARRCARLMAMAEAISEVADVRLEYDAARG